MNPVIHFEMPAVDKKRVADFYSGVFGWKTQMMGEDMGNYIVVSTTESGADGRPTKPGAINGGFFMKSDDNAVPSVVIGVDDVKAHAEKVRRAGGKVLGEPQEIPGIGLWQVFIDPEGNRVSMLQPTR
jgi:predicted enzyme related to lactoylglutathione lyase